MRLNGRGLANIWEHEENKGLDIDCYEFQPSDFDEGIVMLSVEEADEILEEFGQLIKEMDDYNYENGDCFYTDDAHKQLKVLRKRIEQSEGKQ